MVAYLSSSRAARLRRYRTMVALTVRAAQVSRKSARRRIGKSTNRAGLARSRHVVNGMAINRASPTPTIPITSSIIVKPSRVAPRGNWPLHIGPSKRRSGNCDRSRGNVLGNSGRFEVGEVFDEPHERPSDLIVIVIDLGFVDELDKRGASNCLRDDASARDSEEFLIERTKDRAVVFVSFRVRA